MGRPSCHDGDMRSQHRAASLDSQLTLAFGLLGLAGGWLTSELLIWNSNFNRVLMIVCTALVSMGLGYFAPRLWAQSPLLLVLAALLAGAINGVLQMSVLIVASGLHHDIGASLAIVLFTVLVGAVFALPFLPALAAMACCSIHRRRARSGSLLGRAYSRALWRVTALSIAIGCGLASLLARSLQPVTVALALGACAMVLLLAGADLDALRSLRALSQTTVDCRDWVLSDSQLESAARSGLLTDLGVGERIVARVRNVAHAYRQLERPEALCRGDIAPARLALRRLSFGALAMSAVAITLGLLQTVEVLG